MFSECVICGKAHYFDLSNPQLFCSIGCQLKRDPLETENVHKVLRTRPAKTPKRNYDK